MRMCHVKYILSAQHNTLNDNSFANICQISTILLDFELIKNFY